MVEIKNDAWQREAAAIARQFVMTLNGSMLYGCGHPNTAKNATALSQILNESFQGRKMITVILNNGAFMVEDWPLDRSFNTGKLVTHFEKLELTSISFEPGVDADSIIQLIGLAGDANSIEICKAGIANVKVDPIPCIKINYVLYEKITADEIVVKDSPQARVPIMQSMQGASNISTGNLSLEAAAQIEEVLTLTSLLEKPKEVSAILAQTDTSRFPISELHSAFGKIRSELDVSETHNVGELLESIHSLRKDLYEALEVQKATGRMMRSAAVINKELNDLTSSAIVKLVKDEYKSGKTPLNRLAHTIRRMLPNNAELMQILPPLKEMLLAEGMALGDYLELVRMLGLKIESEALSDSLKEAAESMGASVSDLVSAIQSKPEEAARLILLASEIRQGVGADESRLPEMLTGYIEEVCSQMAVETCGTGGHGSGALKKVLAQLESQMFSQLANQGVSQNVMQNVKHLLSQRFNDTYAAANDNLAAIAPKRASHAGGHGKAKMPPEALNANSLLFLINKEIKRNLRYKTQFATITISMEKILQNSGSRPLKPEDTAEILPQLFTCVETLLRDVDLIGALGAENNTELFVLLPMTGEEGAVIVKERVIKKLGETTFTIGNRRVGIAAKVSVTLPDENTADLKSYLAQVRRNHK